MGRRQTNGVTGQTGFGKISVSSNTITTTQSNTDLILDPQGTGVIQAVTVLQVNGDGVSTGGAVRLRNGANTFYTTLISSTLTSNRTLSFPDSAGTSGQMLRTDGAGNLTFATPYVSVTDDVATVTAVYPLLTNVTSDTTASTVYRSSTKLSYIPSTGVLTTTGLFSGTITGSTTASGTLTIRSTNNATKGQVNFDEVTDCSAIGTAAVVLSGGLSVAKQLRVAQAATFSSTISCTTLTETSSIVFKENVKPLQNALDSVLQLSGVMYDRKDGSYKNETGLIAEEVEKIIPYVVTKNEEGQAHGINYTKLVAYLIESIKSLKLEIEELKSR